MFIYFINKTQAGSFTSLHSYFESAALEHRLNKKFKPVSVGNDLPVGNFPVGNFPVTLHVCIMRTPHFCTVVTLDNAFTAVLYNGTDTAAVDTVTN